MTNNYEVTHPPVDSNVITRFNAGKMELYAQHADDPFISGFTIDLTEVR